MEYNRVPGTAYRYSQLCYESITQVPFAGIYLQHLITYIQFLTVNLLFAAWPKGKGRSHLIKDIRLSRFLGNSKLSLLKSACFITRNGFGRWRVRCGVKLQMMAVQENSGFYHWVCLHMAQGHSNDNQQWHVYTFLMHDHASVVRQAEKRGEIQCSLTDTECVVFSCKCLYQPWKQCLCLKCCAQSVRVVWLAAH